QIVWARNSAQLLFPLAFHARRFRRVSIERLVIRRDARLPRDQRACKHTNYCDRQSSICVSQFCPQCARCGLFTEPRFAASPQFLSFCHSERCLLSEESLFSWVYQEGFLASLEITA